MLPSVTASRACFLLRQVPDWQRSNGMTNNSALAIILAAGKGTRMKSERAEGAAPGRRRASARACARGLRRRPVSSGSRSSSARGWTRSRPPARDLDPRLEALRPGRAARDGRCGQGGAARLRRRSPVRFRCFTATRRCSRPETIAPGPRRACRRRRPRGDWLRGGEPDRLWPAAARRPGKARRHPRGEGRKRGGARAHALQLRHHGLPFGQDAARSAGADRQRQRQEGILSHRCRGARPRRPAGGAHGRSRCRGGARRELARRACRARKP